MDNLKKLFAEKNYEAVKAEIYKDPDYKSNALKLNYLASAFYYARDYQGAIATIQLLKPLVDTKTVYSMLIDTEICHGTKADSALEYISGYLREPITTAEKNWADFKRGLCLLAKNQKTEAIRVLETATPMDNETLEIERHFFLNNAKDAYGSGITENERINDAIIEARIERNALLAREARDRAVRAKYGEAEYFATAVLAKYCASAKDQLALRPKSGSVDEIIYYRII